eukprot:scaffold207164_cov28-Prasinocladus_malaysianus.AAC.1
MMPLIHCQCARGNSSGVILPINNDETIKQIIVNAIKFGLLIFFIAALVVICSSRAPGDISACVRMSVTAATFLCLGQSMWGNIMMIGIAVAAARLCRPLTAWSTMAS